VVTNTRQEQDTAKDYRVQWVMVLPDGAVTAGNTSPMAWADADVWAQKMNREYPHIHHWFVRVVA